MFVQRYKDEEITPSPSGFLWEAAIAASLFADSVKSASNFVAEVETVKSASNFVAEVETAYERLHGHLDGRKGRLQVISPGVVLYFSRGGVAYLIERGKLLARCWDNDASGPHLVWDSLVEEAHASSSKTS